MCDKHTWLFCILVTLCASLVSTQLVFPTCVTNNATAPVCSFAPECTCTTNNNGKVSVFCNGSQTTFPKFTFYDGAPITSIYIIGNYTVVYDNSFYLLTTMANAVICLQQSYNAQTLLTIFDNTFATASSNGITALWFAYFAPSNISTLSNSQMIQYINVAGGGLQSLPSLASYTSLITASFPNNKISVLPSNAFDIASLTYIDISDNTISVLPSNAFNSASLIYIDISYNKITSLNSDAFNFDSLKSIVAQYNQIATIDSGFKNWLDLCRKNNINLQNGAGRWICNSNLKWIANYTECESQMPYNITQIFIGPDWFDIYCTNGNLLYSWLSPYTIEYGCTQSNYCNT